MTAIGLVGFGHWGTRLARAIQAEPQCRLAGIVDIDPERRAAARAAHHGMAVHASIDDLAGIDALAIAVYPKSQPGIVRAGLARRLHVLAEKPLAVSAADAGALADLAGRANRVLLVDCTPVYSPLTDAVRACLAEGVIGAPIRYRSLRAHGGRRQPGIDVLLDLAVHDLAVLDASLAVSPLSVAANGTSSGDGLVEAHVDLHCAGGLQARIDVSWTGDKPVRRTIIDGTRGQLCRDDRALSVVLTPHATGANGPQPLDLPDRDDEPLRRLVRHLADCITRGTPPRTGARAASRHIGWLEAAARSIAAAGRAIDLPSGAGS